MNFQEALDYLYQAKPFGIRPGLDRIRELLKRLGNPHRDFPAVHIAGTNGKGSTSSYLAHIAACQGLKTAWFTSPYLETFNERIRIIDGRAGVDRFEQEFRSPEIPDEVFASLMSELRVVIEQMMQEGYDIPTVFEMETALAYLWFSREKVELAVIEVGMGGRLDSTNILEKPLVSVITALSYDHMDRLGSTLGEIAWEKAGIIKEGCPVIAYSPYDAVEDEEEAKAAIASITRKAEEMGSRLTWVSRSEITPLSKEGKGQAFLRKGTEEPYEISLLGRYQMLNAMLAIDAARYFANDDAIREGLRRAVWPGRLELMRAEPGVLIDGAHNIQGVTELGRALREIFPKQDIVYLIGMLADKEHEKMLRKIFEGQHEDPLTVITTSPPIDRALAAEKLAREAAEALNLGTEFVSPLSELEEKLTEDGVKGYNEQKIYYSDQEEEALQLAYRFATKRKCPLVVFGSLYLIGNLRPVLRALIADKRLID